MDAVRRLLSPQSCASGCSCPCATKASHSSAICLDGGLGTALEDAGADIKHDLWNAVLLQSPEGRALIARVHTRFLDAGADIIITSSYQASIDGFQKHFKLSRDAATQLFQHSVRLAVEARDSFWRRWCQSCKCSEACLRLRDRSRPLVSVSAGNFGATLSNGSEFSGAYGDRGGLESLTKFHLGRIDLLWSVARFGSEHGAEALAFETVPSLIEARAILEAVRLFNLRQRSKEDADSKAAGGSKEAAVWLSFSCRSESELCSGDSFADAVKEFLSAYNSSAHTDALQLTAVGVNCTSPKHVRRLLHTAAVMLEALTSTRCAAPLLLAYPNSGEEWSSESMGWKGNTALDLEQWRSLSLVWRSAGASLIGGCCRTTDKHIEVVRKTVSHADVPLEPDLQMVAALGYWEAANNALSRLTLSREVQAMEDVRHRHALLYIQAVAIHALHLERCMAQLISAYYA